MTDHAARVLNYWWALEIFNARQVPQLASPGYAQLAEKDAVRTSDWTLGEPLPWQSTEILPEIKPRYGKNYVWAHRVYLGVYDISKIQAQLASVYGEDSEPEETRRAEGESAAASIDVDSRGRIRLGSLTLSSAVWAVSRASRSHPDNFGSPKEFAGVEKKINNRVLDYELVRIRKRLGIERTGGDLRNDQDLLAEQLPVDESSFANILDMIRGELGQHPLRTERVRISSYQVPYITEAEDKDTYTDDFINSFYLKDLGEIFQRVRAGEITPALGTYLSEKAQPQQGSRCDVLENPQFAEDLLNPLYIPAGRWPSHPGHHLARAQQFTVNRLMKHHRQTGQVLGVNGPPGTGKTTLMRDVIAALVTERAQKLSSLENPAQAFSSSGISYRYQHKDRVFNPLRGEFTGYEMVIVSSNNSAVENISTEIPDREASLDTDRWPEADYFSELASLLLQEARGSASKDTVADAWGMLSGRFGTMANRRAYLDPLFFGGKLRHKVPESGSATANLQLPLENTLGKKTIDGLDTLLKSTAGPEQWQEAREAFRLAQSRVERLRSRYVQANRRRENLSAYRYTLQQLEQKQATDRQKLDSANTDYEAGLKEAEQSKAQLRLEKDRYQRQRELKPGWFENLVSFGASRAQWRQELQVATGRLNSAETADSVCQEQLQQRENRYRELAQLVDEQGAQLRQLRRQVADCEAEVEQDRNTYGDCYPEYADEKQRELSAPWLNEEFNRARSDLFLEALNLHRAFLLDPRTKMRAKLYLARSVILNSADSPLPELRRAAWQVFFLAVPTISSTFASVPTMLTDLPRETFGWLLVDEAGQSNPQEAVGALWRSKNMLAVGDPLQLEPIANVPEEARKYMATYYGVSDDWIPLPASVQTLVDRVALYGAYLGNGDDRRWVSAPLRVHRRCESPMFEISNRVAYDGMMISDTRPSQTWHGEGAKVYCSMWGSTEFRDPQSKVQEHDFERFANLMKHLAEEGVAPSDVIAISPFREIAYRLEKLQRRYPGLRAGTVHRAQGREAPVVVLVLGTAESADGSRRWAAQTPNLVNVAASRAKNRLYVFGNAQKWSPLPHFRVLFDELEKFESENRPGR